MSEPAEQLKKAFPALGIHDDMPEEDYHKSPGINKSGLVKIDMSGRHYQKMEYKSTDAFTLGSAFHCLLLEPQKFDDQFMVNTLYSDFRKKEAREWKQYVIEQGMQVLSKSDRAKLDDMVDSVRNNKTASILCDPDSGKAERSMFWIDNDRSFWEDEGCDPTYRLCRGRLDFYNEAHDLIVDIKTANCAGASKWFRDVWKYRYDVQDVFYTWGAQKCGLKPQNFVFVVIEKEPPYAVGVYAFDRRDIRATQARRDATMWFKRNMRKYHQMMEEFGADQEWPCYPEEIRPIELQGYTKYVDYY